MSAPENQVVSEGIGDTPPAGAVVEEQETDAVQGIFIATVVTPTGLRIQLPPLIVDDAIPFNIKQLLTGYLESCCYSCYVLEYRPNENEPFRTLNDFVELSMIIPDAIQSGAFDLHMVTQPYTLHEIKMHMKQTVEVIEHPRPSVNSNAKNNAVAENMSPKGNKGDNEATASLNKILFGREDDISLKSFYKDLLYKFSKSVSPSNLSSKKGFYSELKSGIHSICYSGWNPPPPQRKLQGDICYLDVETSDRTVCITATANGFYVNRSFGRSSFDPLPADQNCYFSHELLNVILNLSPATAKFVNNPPPAASMPTDWNLDCIALQHAVGARDVFVDESMCWTGPTHYHDGEKIQHEYNTGRAMEDFIGGDALAPISTPAKEWNHEMQQLNSLMPSESGQGYASTKLLQALNRLRADFKETASSVAVSILNGRLTPMNPGEPLEQQIFINNNIFYSFAADTKGSFKLCFGDEACRKMHALDMTNQSYVQATNIPGLNTVLTCLVDYKGYRIVAQSMIPGVLQMGENAARLMYGSIQPGERLKCKTSARKLMKQLGSTLQLTEREINATPNAEVPVGIDEEPALPPLPDNEQNIRVDDKDEEFPVDSDSIQHIGPVECKLLEGTDGKHYLLEVSRLTPRDANYVKSTMGGTGNIPDNVLDEMDESVFVVYTLRQELVYLYRVDYAKAAIMKVYADASESNSKSESNIETGATDIISTPSTSDINDITDESKTNSEDIPKIPSSPALELKKKPESNEGVESAASAASAKAMASIQVNPNVFIPNLDVKSGEKSEEILQDEELARNIANFLWSKVIPTITEDIRLANQVIMDGEALTKYCHEYGINMRYLGRIAEVAREQEATDQALHKDSKLRINPMPAYWLELVEMEMIARSVKHLTIKFMHDHCENLASPARLITDLLSFLFGSPSSINESVTSVDNMSKTASKKKKSKKSSGNNSSVSAGLQADTSSLAPSSASSSCLDRAEFWKLLEARIKTYFGGTLSLIRRVKVDGKEVTELSSRVPLLPLLRRVCQQLGISVATREYSFDSAHPFSPIDLLGFHPRAKMPVTDLLPYVADLRESANVYAQRGELANSSALYQQASVRLEQLYGSQCKEMCLLNEDFAKMLLQSNQFESAYIVLEKNLALSIRLTGLDSQLTFRHHLALGRLSAELGRNSEGWKHLSCAAYLVSVIAGKFHPEASSVLMTMADCSTRANNFTTGLTYLKEVKERFEKGGDIIKLAYINQNMAEFLEAEKAFPEAKAHQTMAYKLFRQLFGDSDSRTVNSKERYAQMLRAAHTLEVNQKERHEQEETARKEKERLLWLDDENATGGDKPKKGKKNKKGSKK